MTPEERAAEFDFCPGCFASSKDGSWGEVVQGQWCMNCGATGTVRIPGWAIEPIRKNASWVGKRYYASDEDKQERRELRYLRSIAPAVEMKVVESRGSGGTRYSVERGNTSISYFETMAQAMVEGARSLPYPVPEDFEAK